MNSIERRKEIYEILKERVEPISASVLAEKFGVTRQIIVKDVGVLKAEKSDILSTARGYLLNKRDDSCSRLIKVCHGYEGIEDELNIIVDLGGRILNTHVEHSVYGVIGQSLNIKSRKDVKTFLENISENQCEPLLTLTNGVHSHLIEADDIETLNEICKELYEKKYLILG